MTSETWDPGFRLNNLCFYINSVLARVSELCTLSKVHTTPVVSGMKHGCHTHMVATPTQSLTADLKKTTLFVPRQVKEA